MLDAGTEQAAVGSFRTLLEHAVELALFFGCVSLAEPMSEVTAVAGVGGMNEPFSSAPGGDGTGVSNPVSWLQIEQGWSVVDSDGSVVGSVLSVGGDKQDDIFDGLAISVAEREPARYVASECVGRIYPGKVTLRLSAADVRKLEVFQAPPPVTVWRPSRPSLVTRLSNWLRGGR